LNVNGETLRDTADVPVSVMRAMRIAAGGVSGYEIAMTDAC
jgi:transglutaminase-like putative cysteine protease